MPAAGQVYATYYVKLILYYLQQDLVPTVAPQQGGQVFVKVHREHTTDMLIDGAFLVNGKLAKILFDLGDTHSFVVNGFMVEIALWPEYFWVPLEIARTYSRSFALDLICRGVEVTFDGTGFSLIWWFFHCWVMI